MDTARMRVLLSRQGFDVTHAATAEGAYDLAVRQSLNLVIVTVELSGTSGLELVRRLRQNPATRALPILVLGTQNRPEDRVAIYEAGADDFIPKPFQSEELVYRVKGLIARAPQATSTKPQSLGRGRIITVFSSKGGTGKTTIAVNVAVTMRKRMNKRVILFDADFFFGDLNIHLNLPSVRTIIDVVRSGDEITSALIEPMLSTHGSGLRVLLSPQHPEDAELVTARHVMQILEVLSATYEYIIVDCHTSYDDRTLAVLEHSDYILMVATPELGAVENTVLFFDLANKLAIPPERIHLVLNRFNTNVGIEQKEIERTLRRPVEFRLPSGGRPVALSLNRGVPLILERPDHPLAQTIVKMAEDVFKAPVTAVEEQPRA
jgi:pilus assembly protein CpaE